MSRSFIRAQTNNMPRSTRITKIERQGNTRTLINFRGGGAKGQLEIPGGVAELREWIRSQLREDHDLLIALALRQWLAQNPSAADFSSIEGKQLTLDFGAANILTVTA